MRGALISNCRSKITVVTLRQRTWEGNKTCNPLSSALNWPLSYETAAENQRFIMSSIIQTLFRPRKRLKTLGLSGRNGHKESNRQGQASGDDTCALIKAAGAAIPVAQQREGLGLPEDIVFDAQHGENELRGRRSEVG